MEDKYLRMVKRMKGGDPYTAYIVRCSDGSLYTGIAKDVEARVKMHNSGKGAAYTRTRRPVELLYQEQCKDRSSALMREIAIKRLPRAKKLELVSPAPARQTTRRATPPKGRGILSLLLVCSLVSPAFAQTDTLLSTLPDGYELDRVEEAGKGSLPRVAWSRGAGTVVYVAISGGRRLVAVNDRLLAVDSVGPLGYTPDGLTPVFVTRSSGTETLHVGARSYGPYQALERPALSADGSRVAFFARSGKELVAMQDDSVVARAPFVGSPVLDADGAAAFWIREGERWTLLWKGKPAPGTPFKSRGGTAALPEVGQPAFSPDGKHVAFSRRLSDGRYAVVRDGKEDVPYLTVGDPVFSPDSQTLAYGASAGPDYELNTMVVNERPITRLRPPGRIELSIRSLWGYRWLRDGRLAWSASLVGGRSVYVTGETASAEYDAVRQQAYDRENRRAAFAGTEGKKVRAVVDGVPGPLYDGVSFLQFDDEGRRFAYTATSGTASFVVLDGEAGESFDEVGWIRFSASGKGIAYWARKGKRWYIVVDGKKTDTGIRPELIGNLLMGGADGSVPVYSVRDGGGWNLVAGKRKEGPYDEIGTFEIAPGGASVTLGTREGRTFRRRTLPLK